MSYAEFLLAIEGYNRRTRQGKIQYRELFTLLSNQWQAEHMKEPLFIHPTDVIRLPGERRPKKADAPSKPIVWSAEKFADIEKMYNRS